MKYTLEGEGEEDTAASSSPVLIKLVTLQLLLELNVSICHQTPISPWIKKLYRRNPTSTSSPQDLSMVLSLQAVTHIGI